MEKRLSVTEVEYRLNVLQGDLAYAVIDPIRSLSDILRNSSGKGVVIEADEYGEVLKLLADGATYRIQEILNKARITWFTGEDPETCAADQEAGHVEN